MNRRFVKKWGVFAAACLLYVLTVVLLYMVQYKFYGGVVRTPLLYVALFPVLAWLGWLLGGGYPKNDEEQKSLADSGIYKEPPKKAKRGRWLHGRRPWQSFFARWRSDAMPVKTKVSFAVSALVLVAATLFMICALVAEPYLLIIYFYFGVLIALGIFTLWEPSGGWKLSVLACAIFLELILITGIYLLIVSPMSVDGGRQMLEAQGYGQVYYEKSADNEKILDTFYDGDLKLLSRSASGLGFYMFRCEKDGIMYGAAISVIDKNIVAAEPLDNESGLDFYMDFD